MQVLPENDARYLIGIALLILLDMQRMAKFGVCYELLHVARPKVRVSIARPLAALGRMVRPSMAAARNGLFFSINTTVLI
ncbi:hypothetical protein TSA66_24210 [Noviherbaspirillum autotrophicum]|uniref:Uncharacterized protein n=1 Tax=Noviherbaspirillum autotrophicum TaxID=709839 RepID=A0A0C2BT61_9BURK|nr:hypothetical protein TSA66_24210 [Noviherbaspirillum autotrophicum]